jgi:hypothetical protein
MTPRLPGFFACASARLLAEPAGPSVLMHDDVLPPVGVGGIAEGMQVDDHQPRNLRLAGSLGERREIVGQLGCADRLQLRTGSLGRLQWVQT